MIQTGTKKLTLAAMFFAIGIILPFFIGQIPLIGQMLLPMHIPVLLCGLIVGWQYGLQQDFSFRWYVVCSLECRHFFLMESAWHLRWQRMDW